MNVCWELWRARNAGRYDDSFIDADRIILNIRENIAAVFNRALITAKRSCADGLILLKLGVKQPVEADAYFIVTKWIRPIISFVKVNSDGCSKGNPGLSGGGSLLRDSSG